MEPRTCPPLPQGTTIASAAYRPWYAGRSELEHPAARKPNQPSRRIAGRSESLRNKLVMTADTRRSDTRRRVTRLSNSSSSLTVPRTTQTEIVACYRSSSAVTRSLSNGVYEPCDAGDATASLGPGAYATRLGEVADFRVGAPPGTQFVARTRF